MTDQNIVGSVEIQARLNLERMEADRQKLEARLREIPNKQVLATLKLEQFEQERKRLESQIKAITAQQAKVSPGLKFDQLEMDRQKLELKLKAIPDKKIQVELKAESAAKDAGILEAKLNSLANSANQAQAKLDTLSVPATAGNRVNAYAGAVIDATYRSAQFAQGLTIVSNQLDSAGSSVDQLRNHVFGLYVEFDKAVGKVGTLSDKGKELGEASRKTAADLQYQASAAEILEGSYQILSSGYTNVADVQLITANSLKAAVGGFTDTETAANALTSILNSYKLSAQESTRVTDQMLQVQNLGKIVVKDYAEQIGRLAPIAALGGVKLEELNAAVAASTASGLPAESAFTGLRQAITTIIDPSEKAKKLAAELGIEFNAAALRSKGFTGVLADISAKGGATAENMTILFDNVRAFAAVAPLVGNNFKDYQKALEGINNSAGMADRGFNQMANTLSGQMRAATNEANDALMELGKGAANAIIPFVKAGTELIRLFNQLPDPVKQAAGASLTLTGALLGTGAAITGVAATIGFMISLLAAAKTNWAILTGETIASTVATTANTAAEVANTAALGANSAAAATNATATNAAAAAKGGLAAGAGRLIATLGPLSIKIALIIAAIETWKTVMGTFWGGEAGNFIEGLDKANKKMDELARKRPPSPQDAPQQPGATGSRGDRQDALARMPENFARQFKELLSLNIPGFLSATTDQWSDLFAVIRGGKGSTSALGEEWGFLTRTQQGNQQAQLALEQSQGRLNQLNNDAVKILLEYKRTGKINEDQFKATDETLSAYIATLKDANEKHGAAVPAISGALSQLEALQKQLRAAKDNSQQYAGAIQQQTTQTQQLATAEEKAAAAKKQQQQAQEAMLLRIQRNTIAIEQQKRALEDQSLAYQKVTRDIDAYLKTAEQQNRLQGITGEIQVTQNKGKQNETDFDLERLNQALEIRREIDSGAELSTAKRTALEQKLIELTGSSRITELNLLQQRQKIEQEALAQKRDALNLELNSLRAAQQIDQQRNVLSAERALQEAKIIELRAKQQLLDAGGEVNKAKEEIGAAAKTEGKEDDIRAQDALRRAQKQQRDAAQQVSEVGKNIKEQELAVERVNEANERQNLLLEERNRMMIRQLDIERERLLLRQRFEAIDKGQDPDKFVPGTRRQEPVYRDPKEQAAPNYSDSNKYYLDRLRQMAPQTARPELSQVNIGREIQSSMQQQNTALGEIVQRVGAQVTEAIRANPTVGTLNVQAPAKEAGNIVGSLASNRLRKAGK